MDPRGDLDASVEMVGNSGLRGLRGHGSFLVFERPRQARSEKDVDKGQGFMELWIVDGL